MQVDPEWAAARASGQYSEDELAAVAALVFRMPRTKWFDKRFAEVKAELKKDEFKTCRLPPADQVEQFILFTSIADTFLARGAPTPAGGRRRRMHGGAWTLSVRDTVRAICRIGSGVVTTMYNNVDTAIQNIEGRVETVDPVVLTASIKGAISKAAAVAGGVMVLKDVAKGTNGLIGATITSIISAIAVRTPGFVETLIDPVLGAAEIVTANAQSAAVIGIGLIGLKLTRMMWAYIAENAQNGDAAARALMENPADRAAALRVLMDLARVPPQAGGKPRLIMKIIAKVGQVAPRVAELIDASSGSDADTEGDDEGPAGAGAGAGAGGPAGAGAGAASEGGRRRRRSMRNKRTKRRRGHRRGRGTRKH
jgi:hypothetical protein